VLFGGLGLVPTTRDAAVGEQAITWNYTTYLNIIFLALAAALVVQFFRTGGRPMLAMMGGSPDDGHEGHGDQEGHGGHADHEGRARGHSHHQEPLA